MQLPTPPTSHLSTINSVVLSDSIPRRLALDSYAQAKTEPQTETETLESPRLVSAAIGSLRKFILRYGHVSTLSFCQNFVSEFSSPLATIWRPYPIVKQRDCNLVVIITIRHRLKFPDDLVCNSYRVRRLSFYLLEFFSGEYPKFSNLNSNLSGHLY